ncbi:maleylpyruvate isomerase family mycothiol-dependent enzyme [Nocardioides sp.]|uniref:maleylpyruvate isomerase family mycothiol-dependent enzyme n=1 Tax=Nocardioides sp. TaxID=35761 RepID=UPI002C24ABD9|nr:maleylpyruvate isomerase family mycothiol-dependent enzyme [Nocardioides sp.]HXH78569.1 maleylpyruvate isomerase family mycothiol-dependent enzyme [Nocardioides sp.]
MTHSVEPTQLELLTAANQRLVRTVDGLDDSTYAHASLLPEWTVGHVLAHLALNGEGLAGALRGVTTGAGTPMYESQEARNRDIAALGVAVPSEIRARVEASTQLFDRELSALPHDQWEATIERTPGNPAFRARSTVLMRLREVEIHHADLGLDYSNRDWVPAFSVQVIESAVKRAGDWPVPFRVLARDLAQTWELGDGEPAATVSGDAHDLAWWLTGRDDRGTLTVDHDELPEVPAW